MHNQVGPRWLNKEDANIGRTWNNLTAVELVERLNYVKKYLFLCTCGNTRIARLGNVISGQTKECSICASTRTCATHALSDTPIYKCWAGMKTRINGNCNPLYANRTYEARWEAFEEFNADMKDSYFKGAVLDRIDNSKGYSKANCQWLTKSEHAYKTWEDRNVGIQSTK